MLSVILSWLEGNISSPVKCSYLFTLPDEGSAIFAALFAIWNVTFLI